MKSPHFYTCRYFTAHCPCAMRPFAVSLLVATLLLGPPSAVAQTHSLEDSLRPLIDRHQGTVAVAVKHLPSGESFTHRADEPMPTASLIKFPVMIAAYDAILRGELDGNDLLTLREEDKVPGSGILSKHFSDGAPLLLRDAIRLMIAYSDNTATNLVVDKIGIESTARLMESLGCAETKLHSKVYRRDTSVFPERSQRFGLGSTTAAEMIALFEKLHARELVSAEASEVMLEHLLACEDQNKIARSLPKGVRLAHKTGSVAAVRTDAGILLGPGGDAVVICVLTNDNEDQSWSDGNEAEALCAAIGRAVCDHFFSSSTTSTDSRKTLKIGAGGPIVQALQRTLNARLEPSPELSVDGDFGAQTQAAVEAFQKQSGLSISGEVDAATWMALGVLVDTDTEVPAPEVINAQQLEKQPADSPDGPPSVTCRVWAIGDGNSGKLLWGHCADEPVDMASTTKIMTAYVVLKLAEQDPSVLEETVTFSAAAAKVGGSSSGLREGERLSVRELLYGLMLPSGNDASVALAEHFGTRVAESPSEARSEEAVQHFIAAMNREAKALGMQQSHFVNTHGLTAKGHAASAKDLITLAHRAFQIPLFRDIVSTRQRGCAVEGPGGDQRNVLWKNTNRLLATTGYGGVKTGTTKAAGACLVSYAERDGRSLFAVVLGSSDSDARYSDTRNLYRWAWGELEKEAVAK